MARRALSRVRRGVRRRLAVKVGLGLGTPLFSMAIIALSLWASAWHGSHQVEAVLRRSQQADEIRGLKPHVVRAAAYAQIYAQGDRSFDSALVQEIQLIQEQVQRLEGSAEDDVTWERRDTIHGAALSWTAMRDALTRLMRTEPDSVYQAPSALMVEINQHAAALQDTLDLLEQATLTELEIQANLARAWPRAFRFQAWLMLYAVGATTLLAAVFLFWSILRPLAHLRRAAVALARGRPPHRMQDWPEDEFGSLADALNALAGRKRRRRNGS